MLVTQLAKPEKPSVDCHPFLFPFDWVDEVCVHVHRCFWYLKGCCWFIGRSWRRIYSKVHTRQEQKTRREHCPLATIKSGNRCGGKRLTMVWLKPTISEARRAWFFSTSGETLLDCDFCVSAVLILIALCCCRRGCVTFPMECRWQVPRPQGEGSHLHLRTPIHASAGQEVVEGTVCW